MVPLQAVLTVMRCVYKVHDMVLTLIFGVAMVLCWQYVVRKLLITLRLSVSSHFLGGRATLLFYCESH